ncbi:hypothetical protein H6P81_000042 [Aristolochia fimbriata]|uniref:R domain-containing protein n=1 Tax=Aristolochia fimbriata TaxID=158543 RepID=A0AAV7F3Q2_ARIFI|nr:hypothetical protein H6P81_000042 [Aristolochia fimbriata]
MVGWNSITNSLVVGRGSCKCKMQNAKCKCKWEGRKADFEREERVRLRARARERKRERESERVRDTNRSHGLEDWKWKQAEEAKKVVPSEPRTSRLVASLRDYCLLVCLFDASFLGKQEKKLSRRRKRSRRKQTRPRERGTDS